MEDHRKKKDDDGSEKEDKDQGALNLGGKNPLAEEESVEEDDSGGD